MTTEEQIEEILMEANSMGFRNELLERVRIAIRDGSHKRRVDIYEEEFQKILIEMRE